MKRFCRFFFLSLFIALPALAEGDLLITIQAVGATASGAVKFGQRYEIQCDGDSRFRTGSSTVVVTNTNAATTKGRKVLKDTLVEFRTNGAQNYVAVIPADGTSTVNCDIFEKPKLSGE